MNREIKSRELKFRAVISKNTIVYFTLKDMIDPLFSMRELVFPWLYKGNQPDEYTGLKDSEGKEMYEGDIVEVRVEQILDHKDVVGVVGIKPDATYVDFPQYGSSMGIGYFEEILVVGNEHQNPELLEGE